MRPSVRTSRLAFQHANAMRQAPRAIATFAKRDDLLSGVSSENRDDVARVLELAERARDTWVVNHSQFLKPPVVSEAMMVLQRLADISAVPWGGYSQAERCRISVGREDALSTVSRGDGTVDRVVADSVAALSITGNFLFDPATHRDFLGAILGTGIERHMVGDILIQGENGAQALVVPSMVEHLESALVQVRSVPVKTRAILAHELRVAAPKVVEIHSVESSLRLDAVGSAGFRISRSKMMDCIKGGDVRLNWKEASKASIDVNPGDVISCSGKGRVEVKSISQTKKGKWAVDMVRYV